MKKILITLFAVIATASLGSASGSDHGGLPEFTVSAEQYQFIDARLEAVVDELTAEALAHPIPESVLTSKRLRPRMVMVHFGRPERGETTSGDQS